MGCAARRRNPAGCLGLLTIVQTGFENENDRDGVVEGGWPRILDALERVVAERRST